MARLSASLAKRALRQFGSPQRAAGVTRFFKAGKGEYGEGDVFIGCTVPECRLVAKEFLALPLAEVDKLITSRIHEDRLVALLIMVSRFERSKDEAERKKIFQLYRRRMAFVNNWDLVDGSAPYLVGPWLEDKPRGLLDTLAKSKVLWYRRIAMVATFHFIRHGESEDAIRIAGLLVDDRHDLIHKAVGWMLREVEKRASAEALDGFLERHAATMPRTMLRYAIERLTPAQKAKWMGFASAPRTRRPDR
ncbi:MAG: DNA alkylation repair protein [Gammaproteobacteria bacterium]